MLATSTEGKKDETDSYTTAGLSYNVQQLQAEFHVLSPREVYAELCARHHCHPISAVFSLLSARLADWDYTTTLDLSRLYVGSKGIRPVVELCKRLSSLRSLNCSNNYLTNDSVYFITRMAMYHPTLEILELSGNEFISWTGGTYLGELVLCNQNIKEVGIRATAIPARVAEAVFEQTRKNCVLACQAAGRMPKPSNHPTVIHLRAMKRFFLELQEDGTVPASALAEGFRERLRILGQERDLSAYTDKFFESFCSRVPTERITWEAFMLTLRLDSSVYDEELVKKMLRVFMEFNVEPNAGIDGFVEVRDLAAAYTRLNGKSPTPAEINSLYNLLGLDDTMTLQWDEFLLLMYVRGPNDESKSKEWLLTSLSCPTTSFHS